MSLTWKVSTHDAGAQVAHIIIIPVWENQKVAVTLAEPVARLLRTMMQERDWQGAWGTAAFFVRPVVDMGPLVALVGLGSFDQSFDRTKEALRRGIGVVVRDAHQHGLSEVAVFLKGLPAVAALAGAAFEAASLANYSFTEFSDRLYARAQRQFLRLCTMVVDEAVVDEVTASLRAMEPVVQGVELARTLVNRPAGHMSPATLVAEARRIVRRNPRLFSVTIFNRSEARKKGFTAFLAVAQGSSEEPYVIHMRYQPRRTAASTRLKKGRKHKNIFLVGKGVTFDSGGLSLKPAEYMEDMKIDMAGAATVLGVFEALVSLQPNVEVHGIICACENMPSGTAYRPGDILKTMNGKTIEVLNTDAEGRITLADALTYAVKQSPDAIIDFATLTGASMVGLGETVAGLWGTSEPLLEGLRVALSASGEQATVLPMPDEYRVSLESRVADLRNNPPTRFGGAIIAAMFLREFVGSIPWAHFDMAGPAYFNRSYLSYWGVGASGYGVRMIIHYLQHLDSAYVKSS